MDSKQTIPILESADRAALPVGNFRWVICALLFFATTINYVDRQVIALLAPTLGKQIGWNEKQYGNIITCFQIAYAIGLLVSGPIIDALGTRVGYSLSLIIWSLAAMGHGLVRSVSGFASMRFLLGLGEAGNFPAACKTVAEWFPRKERALATGIFNAGSGIGAIAAPLTVPWIALHLGWQWAFYITGGVGLLWLAVWLPIYRRPAEQPLVSPGELAYILSDPADQPGKIPWIRLLPYRQTWAIIAGKFLPDAVWWFYLFWIPKFLDKSFHVSLSKIGLPLLVVYGSADLGSIAGGWGSSHLIKRGWSVNRARKTAMLICAFCVLPVTYAPHARHVWTAIILLAAAAGGHQGWSANIFTFASDLFPRRAVASVVGIGGMAGAIGGILLAQFIGNDLQLTGSYSRIFLIAGATYMGALLLIQLLTPRMEPVQLDLRFDRASIK
jgi:ACS family hexuronate transporter-like MFS transporter